jgi:hypothetical protein
MWSGIMESIKAQHPEFIPKKLMGARINCPRKTGQPQKSCHNLPITILQVIILNMSKDGKLKDFFNLASNESIFGLTP